MRPQTTIRSRSAANADRSSPAQTASKSYTVIIEAGASRGALPRQVSNGDADVNRPSPSLLRQSPAAIMRNIIQACRSPCSRDSPATQAPYCVRPKSCSVDGWKRIKTETNLFSAPDNSAVCSHHMTITYTAYAEDHVPTLHPSDHRDGESVPPPRQNVTGLQAWAQCVRCRTCRGGYRSQFGDLSPSHTLEWLPSRSSCHPRLVRRPTPTRCRLRTPGSPLAAAPKSG